MRPDSSRLALPAFFRGQSWPGLWRADRTQTCRTSAQRTAFGIFRGQSSSGDWFWRSTGSRRRRSCPEELLSGEFQARSRDLLLWRIEQRPLLRLASRLGSKAETRRWWNLEKHLAPLNSRLIFRVSLPHLKIHVRLWRNNIFYFEITFTGFVIEVGAWDSKQGVSLCLQSIVIWRVYLSSTKL